MRYRIGGFFWLLLMPDPSPSLVSLFVGFLLVCGSASAEERPVTDTVRASSALLQRLQVAPVGEGHANAVLRMPGSVELDELRVARIGSAVSGRIVEILARLGQPVTKGEVLARLHSTDLGAVQAAYLKALSQVNLKRLAADRAQRLAKAGAVSEVIATERQHELQEVEVERKSSADQLSLMGMSEGDIQRLTDSRAIDSKLAITATLGGTIIERNITLGQVVQPADAVYTIADLSELWVVAEAPEQDARWVSAGDQAEVEIPAVSGEPIKGRLVYVADLVDPQTRTVTVRMAMPNPQRLFKPKMLATLVIRKQGTRDLVLPDAAVVRGDNRDYVFVETAPAQFALRPVELGIRDGEVRRVLKGLQRGERVVVDGAFHLNNERLRKELE